MSYNFADLEEITQEEYDRLEANFNRLASGCARFGWVNENKTVISFYAYGITRGTNADNERALNLNGEWDVRCEYNGGHDMGTYGTIRKKANINTHINRAPAKTINYVLAKAVEAISKDIFNETVKEPEGRINITITSSDGSATHHVYDLTYGFIGGGTFIGNASHPTGFMNLDNKNKEDK